MKRGSIAKITVRDKKSITYVGKAKAWCVTVWKDNIQKQHWFDTKQEAEQFLQEDK